MKDQKFEGPSWPVMLFLSWFFTGKSPKAPGTVGSLATLPLIVLLHSLKFNTYSLIGFILGLTAIAIFVTDHVQRRYHLHDPQWIVIDEVIGMLIGWSFVQSVDISMLIVVFVLFRIFDIVKVWPASYFDRLEHGSGTIIDDVISGLYAGIISFFIQKFL